MRLGQELKFKNKLCNLKLGTFFSALPGLGASALSGRVEQNLRNLNNIIIYIYIIRCSICRFFGKQQTLHIKDLDNGNKRKFW